VTYPVSFRHVAIDIVRAENDFEGSTSDPTRMWKAFGATAAGCTPTPTSRLTERVFRAMRTHVAGEYELATAAPTAARIFAIVTTEDLL